MDSLGAMPGTGPATSPMPVIRRVKAAKTFADLPRDRAVVMAILNVTPDSFSDGGQFVSTEAAVAHGLRLHYGGADIIDVGGESTRPDSVTVPAQEEQRRILPVIKTLVAAGALVSVDTMNASTAAEAIDAGAAIINDVSGINYDPAMPALIAERGVHYVLMHSRGAVKSVDAAAEYDDVVGEVVAELSGLRDSFVAAGVAPEQLILDPGLGFNKQGRHNWAILQGLEKFTALGHPVLIGASRKRFLGTLLATAGKAAAPAERDQATAALSAIAAAHGAWGVRVHDAEANLDAVKVAAAFTGGGTD